MSKFEKYLQLLEMATPDEKAIAQKTSRNMGAVGANAVVPKMVRKYANRDKDIILDFGAGKAAAHTLALRDEGYNVTAYDFSESEHHDPAALNRKYTMVFASNVLNVQGSEDMLMNDTLKPIYKVLKSGGRFIGNLPSSPLKGLYKGLSYKEAITLLESKLSEVFGKVERLEGSTPIWLCTK
jgi:SAM-dependent methyltransferase